MANTGGGTIIFNARYILERVLTGKVSIVDLYKFNMDTRQIVSLYFHLIWRTTEFGCFKNTSNKIFAPIIN